MYFRRMIRRCSGRNICAHSKHEDRNQPDIIDSAALIASLSPRSGLSAFAPAPGDEEGRRLRRIEQIVIRLRFNRIIPAYRPHRRRYRYRSGTPFGSLGIIPGVRGSKHE